MLQNFCPELRKEKVRTVLRPIIQTGQGGDLDRSEVQLDGRRGNMSLMMMKFEWL